MSERLTEYKTIDGESNYYVLKRNEEKAIDKLSKLEDVMERLKINSVADLEDEIKSLRIDKEVYRKQCNTWKKACELACDDVRGLYCSKDDYCKYCPCDKICSGEMSDNCAKTNDFVEYFYTQARKEIENE